MKICVLSVGDSKISYIQAGEKDYLDRLKHYTKIELKSVKPEKILSHHRIEKIQDSEGVKLLNTMPQNRYLISLDQIGKMMTSEKFAGRFLKFQDLGVNQIVFIIGGALGLSDKVKKISDEIISMSQMTFPHEMCRLFLLEQIYRAFTIIRGEKYHK